MFEEGTFQEAVQVRVVEVETGDDIEASGLTGIQWSLVRLHNSNGDSRSFELDEPYSITFLSDGRFVGKADCNLFGGEYETGPDNGLSLYHSHATLAECGPSSAAVDVLRVLGGLSRYVLEDGQLILKGEEGELHMTS